MKNKEIEELLNELSKSKEIYYDNYDYIKLNCKEQQLLSSYIEELEKRNKELYEGFMATQEELTDYAIKNEQLEADYKEANDSITWWTNRYNAIVKQNDDNHKKVVKLENNRDKAIEILGNYKHYSTPTEEQNRENEDIVDNAYNILKGDSE